MKTEKAKCGYGLFSHLLWVLILGLVLGALVGFLVPSAKPTGGNDWVSLFVLGFAGAYFLLALADAIRQAMALAGNPLPDECALTDRAIAAERLAALQGQSPLVRHIRRLLSAWSAGASGPQIAAMASTQMNRSLTLLAAETAGFVALLYTIAPAPALLSASGLLCILILLEAIARFQLATHAAGYIESHLLARIGNDTPAAAATDFAGAAAKAVASSAEALAKAQTESAAAFAKAQEKTSSQLAQAQEGIVKQLDRIAGLAGSIDQILQLQKSVDGTLKGVTAAEEFKSTLVELKRHLAESDNLLKNAAKPRTLRLVENPGEE